MSTTLALPAVFRFPLIAFIVIFSTGCLDGNKGSQGPAGAAGAAGSAGPAGAGVLGFDRIDANETTSATAYGDLATAGPTAAFSLGAPGDVYVDFGAFIQVCNGNDESAFVSVSVDGSAPTDNDAVIVGQSFSDCHHASASRVLRLSLAAGAHTIALKYRTDIASPVNFSRRWLRVTGG